MSISIGEKLSGEDLPADLQVILHCIAQGLYFGLLLLVLRVRILPLRQHVYVI